MLLIASGPNAKDYKNEIEKYIKNKKPYVIAVNTDVKIEKKLIDIYAACNPLKLIANTENYKNLKSPLAIPKTLINKEIKKKFKNVKIFDFGVGLEIILLNSIKMEQSYQDYSLFVCTFNSYKWWSKKNIVSGLTDMEAQNIRTKILDELLH